MLSFFSLDGTLALLEQVSVKLCSTDGFKKMHVLFREQSYNGDFTHNKNMLPLYGKSRLQVEWTQACVCTVIKL